MKNTILFICSLLLFACTGPQKPYQFAVSSDKNQAIIHLRGVLAENGHETEYMDEQAGIIRTRWVDTGFLMGNVQGQSATIVRRYTVVINNTGHGLTLTLRADTKRCAQHRFVFAGEIVTGACEVMNQITKPHQKELTELGVRLETGLNRS